MKRRNFLALLASAPIAALVPWTRIVQQPPLAFHRGAFEFAMAPLRETWAVGSPQWAIWNPDFEVRVTE